jgi:hypothetical protein
MSKPVRVQLSRKAGWRMPFHTINVARPGKWGNPFRVGQPGPGGSDIKDRAEAVLLFRQMLDLPGLLATIGYPDDLTLLRGKNLACWCSLDGPCHADVLLERANR